MAALIFGCGRRNETNSSTRSVHGKWSLCSPNSRQHLLPPREPPHPRNQTRPANPHANPPPKGRGSQWVKQVLAAGGEKQRGCRGALCWHPRLKLSLRTKRRCSRPCRHRCSRLLPSQSYHHSSQPRLFSQRLSSSRLRPHMPRCPLTRRCSPLRQRLKYPNPRPSLPHRRHLRPDLQP